MASLIRVWVVVNHTLNAHPTALSMPTNAHPTAKINKVKDLTLIFFDKCLYPIKTSTTNTGHNLER